MSENLEELIELLDDLVTEGNNRRADYNDFGKYPSMDKADELKAKVLALFESATPQWAKDLATAVRNFKIYYAEISPTLMTADEEISMKEMAAKELFAALKTIPAKAGEGE